MKNIITLTLLSFGILLTIGCSEDSEQVFQDQQAEIDDYVAEKGWADTIHIDDTGIVLYLEEEGTGAEYPSVNSSVTVHYEGRLLDDTKFDSSFDRGQPSTFSLGGVISGWRIGIPEFRRGDKGYLIIPSRYGYGSRGTTGIPGNSVLVFYIEMIDFD